MPFFGVWWDTLSLAHTHTQAATLTLYLSVSVASLLGVAKITKASCFRNCWISKCDLFSSRVIALSLQGTFTHSPNPQMEISTSTHPARIQDKCHCCWCYSKIQTEEVSLANLEKTQHQTICYYGTIGWAPVFSERQSKGMLKYVT